MKKKTNINSKKKRLVQLIGGVPTITQAKKNRNNLPTFQIDSYYSAYVPMLKPLIDNKTTEATHINLTLTSDDALKINNKSYNDLFYNSNSSIKNDNNNNLLNMYGLSLGNNNTFTNTEITNNFKDITNSTHNKNFHYNIQNAVNLTQYEKASDGFKYLTAIPNTIYKDVSDDNEKKNKQNELRKHLYDLCLQNKDLPSNDNDKNKSFNNNAHIAFFFLLITISKLSTDNDKTYIHIASNPATNINNVTAYESCFHTDEKSYAPTNLDKKKIDNYIQQDTANSNIYVEFKNINFNDNNVKKIIYNDGTNYYSTDGTDANGNNGNMELDDNSKFKYLQESLDLLNGMDSSGNKIDGYKDIFEKYNLFTPFVEIINKIMSKDIKDENRFNILANLGYLYFELMDILLKNKDSLVNNVLPVPVNIEDIPSDRENMVINLGKNNEFDNCKILNNVKIGSDCKFKNLDNLNNAKISNDVYLNNDNIKFEFNDGDKDKTFEFKKDSKIFTNITNTHKIEIKPPFVIDDNVTLEITDPISSGGGQIGGVITTTLGPNVRFTKPKPNSGNIIQIPQGSNINNSTITEYDPTSSSSTSSPTTSSPNEINLLENINDPNDEYKYLIEDYREIMSDREKKRSLNNKLRKNRIDNFFNQQNIDMIPKIDNIDANFDINANYSDGSLNKFYEHYIKVFKEIPNFDKLDLVNKTKVKVIKTFLDNFMDNLEKLENAIDDVNYEFSSPQARPLPSAVQRQAQTLRRQLAAGTITSEQYNAQYSSLVGDYVTPSSNTGSSSDLGDLLKRFGPSNNKDAGTSGNNREDEDVEKDALDDSDVGQQLKEAKGTLSELIKQIGKPDVASQSYYQKKLQKVDDGLARLKLLETSVQEVKLDKDPYKGLFSDFKWITTDMRKELKDKQLLSSTKEMHDKLLKDKLVGKMYREQLEVNESTINKKLDKVLLARDNQSNVFLEEFREIMQKSMNSSSNKDLLLNVLKKRHQSTADRGVQNVICSILHDLKIQFSFDTNFVNKVSRELTQKDTDGVRGICHGNVRSLLYKDSGKGKSKKKDGKKEGKNSKKK